MFHFLIKRTQRDSTERTQRNTARTKKNILPALLSLLLLFTLAFSCVSRTVINRKILAQNIQFASTTPTALKVGDTGILSVTVEPLDHTDGFVMWESNDINVISLNLAGSSTATYSANNPGKATITATVGTTSISIDSDLITVSSPAKRIVFTTTTPLTLEVGDTGVLSVTVEPLDHTDGDVMWESSNPSVLLLNPSGATTTYSADNPGTVTITVTVGTTSISRTITVGIPAESIEFTTPPPLTLEVGDTGDLSVTVEPLDHTDGAVVWQSSDPDVLSLNPSGATTTYSADNPGTVTITATVGTTSVSIDSDPITISSPAKSIEFATSPPPTLRVNDTGVLSVTVTPSNHTDGAIVWQSSDISVLSVTSIPDTNIASYSAKSIRTVTITASVGTASITHTFDIFGVDGSIMLDFEVPPPPSISSLKPGTLFLVIHPTDHGLAGEPKWQALRSDILILDVADDGLSAEYRYTGPTSGTTDVTITFGTASLSHTFTITP